MTRQAIAASILFVSVGLAGCLQDTSNRMPGATATPSLEKPETTVIAPAARDVNSQGGLTRQEPSP